MTTIVDVSGKLGEYMLKGWILTDEICTQCRKVPLMRSPKAPISHFCANCDNVSATPSASFQAPSNQPGATQIRMQSLPSSTSTSHRSHSRSSTPPTEISDSLSSPTFALPVDTEEIMRRRQQSDNASSEIGRRMLKGWAMLAEECPNLQCYGIPLVRPPKTGAEKDPRKECVVCGTVYVEENDEFGGKRLVPLIANATSDSTNQPLANFAQAAPTSSITITARDKGKARLLATSEAPPPFSMANAKSPLNIPLTSSSPTYVALDSSAKSLELALHALSERMMLLAGGPILDPSVIAQTADAMSKVSQALTQVKQLQWSEREAVGA
ncbi:uncharacterized protein FIBRA_07875 [Fibroporia radiculosa]|uniref:Sjogrens syndrome scleroderma autoantigen 1 family protein n=1 Tax=Fibroporia radiculosa TaxID=599839 RepID=J4GVS3_9APHY|nr:uncharacterized protein FIBRA_07875 [Fibroporia radiculosa]CCM05645.1 predicted protein [Fibroporia radiculosa]